MTTINTKFSEEIKKYGATDFEACFNCGTCTAICGLTDQNANFPRKFIRSGVLGQKDDILNSKELWLCYSCSDCTTNCPRQAAPAEYMSALRRFAIANYEPTGITKLIFKNNIFSLIFTLLLAAILGFFLLTLNPNEVIARWIFEFVPYEIIHNLGIVIFAITGVSIALGLVKMWLRLSKTMDKNPPKKKKKNTPIVALQLMFNELATMKRYKSCDNEEYSFWKSKKSILQPWFVHWSIMWGFLGLLAATTLDFVFKDPSTTIWLPSRILGTIAGIFMVYGTSLAIYYRLTKITLAYSVTKLADWMFLFFLWLAGITGFWIEIAVSIEDVSAINHFMMIFHVIISMELVLLFAFSKFAHAVYRPMALFLYFKSV